MTTLDRFPRWFLVETVNSCNSRCVMCGIDFDKKAKAVMADDVFRSIIDEIAGWPDHVLRVTLTLDGEPLIDKKLPDRIRRVKQAGPFEAHISTNASLLTEKTGRALIEAGLDLVYITVDSLKKDVYDAIRVGLDFDVVYENVLNFVTLRDRLGAATAIRVQMVQQEANYDEADDFEAHWGPILSPRDQVVVQRAHNWGNAAEVMKFGDEDQVNDHPCIAPFGTCVILVDGSIRLCCMDVEDTCVLGKVQDASIAELWRGERMRAAREVHLSGRREDIAICDGCTLWREDKQTFHAGGDAS